MKYLNLGCGNRYSTAKEWTNIDFAASEYVIGHNLLNGIPFPNNTFNLVYHSHIIEHFETNTVDFFISECFRVLKPGGVVRIATPNLEEIILLYQKNLNKSLKGDLQAQENYEWLMLELFDQCTRKKSGGGMATYLKKEDHPNEKFLKERIGTMYELIKSGKKNQNHKTSLLDHIRYNLKLLREKNSLVASIYSKVDTFLHLTEIEIGRFIQSGELHYRLYDKYSLKKLLENNKFINFSITSATTSSIKNWTDYNLDTNREGSVNKPDSIFVEAYKP